jgi:uncharacterized protein YndB with AHSA1/START domain
MKYLKYAVLTIAALILAAIATLLIMGQRESASAMRAEVEIQKPAAAIWPYLTEPAKVKQWVGWVVDIQSTTPGVTGVGAKALWTMEDRNNGNQRMQMNDEVIAYEPNRLVRVRVFATGTFTGESSYELTETGGKTRLVNAARFTFEEWFAKLLSPVIMPSAQAKAQEDLERLKGIVEKL